MRKVYLCLTVSLVLAVLSCSKDDGNDIGLITVENDPTEEVSLNANEVSQNIEIRGAIREQGNAPAPNGDITFTIDDSNQSAFQKNGFDIKLQAPENYAGVYIQLKSDDGVASEYFDVPAGAGKAAQKRVSKKRILASKFSQRVDTEVEIDVDFNNVPPGKFCYLICVYDGDGFVSQPSEVCVDVEAWGGNPNLVGTWTFTKFIEDGITTERGEENCEPQQTVNCADGNTIQVDNAYCYTILSLPLTFNADGTYGYTSEEEDKDLDFPTTVENCEAVFVSEKYNTVSKGNWAYDEEEGKLTLVEFEYTENGETEVSANGYLLFDGKATIEVNSLIIRDTYNEAGIEYTSNFYFTK